MRQAVGRAAASDAAEFAVAPANRDPRRAWLDATPAGWDLLRLKDVAPLRNEVLPEDTAPDTEIGYVDISSVDAILGIKRVEPLAFAKAPSRARRVVRHGDVIISTVRTYLRAVAAITDPPANLIVSTGFAVLRPTTRVLSRFLSYAVRAPYFIDRVVAHSEGVSYPAIAPASLQAMPIAVPPLSQQRAIADFLDRETAKIDDLVAKNERLLALLEEKRAAAVSRAVTSGLDPKANMTRHDRGVPLTVPSHWRAMKLKRCLHRVEQGWSPECENRPADEDEWAVLKVGCVNGGVFRAGEHKALPRDVPPLPEFEIATGDVLMSRANTTDLLGSAALVDDVRPRMLLCDKLYRLRVVASVLDPAYLVLLLASRPCRFQMERDATGASASMQNIGQDTVRELLVPLPPLAEQRAIVAHLDRETARIDALRDLVVRASERLREYRTALISAAVTGQIDVRDHDGRTAAIPKQIAEAGPA